MIYVSMPHIFVVKELTATICMLQFSDGTDFLDEAGAIGTPFAGMDGEPTKGFAQHIYDSEDTHVRLALCHSPSDGFRSGTSLGTGSLGPDGQTVKASTT